MVSIFLIGQSLDQKLSKMTQGIEKYLGQKLDKICRTYIDMEN